jgi:hypothetical protein
MAISTYAELKTAVANWLDNSQLTSRIPEFITMSESAIGRDVRIRQMEKRATASISTEYADMPTDFILARNIQINSTGQDRLKYLTPEQMDIYHPAQTTGQPRVYSIIGTEFQFKPVPDATYEIEIAYFARFSALSGDNDTNWLLTNQPGIYLYGSLVQAAPYVDDDQRTALWASLYNAEVEAINKQDNEARCSGAALQMRTDVGE